MLLIYFYMYNSDKHAQRLFIYLNENPKEGYFVDCLSCLNEYIVDDFSFALHLKYCPINCSNHSELNTV